MPRVTVTIPEQSPQPYRFDLDRELVTIGRGSENDISIACGSVSVKHAEMRRVSRGYELRDLGSTNGIRLHDEPKQHISLKNGLDVRIGDVVFDFFLSDEELAALSAEPERLPPLPADAANCPATTSEQTTVSTPENGDDHCGHASKKVIGFVVLAVLLVTAFVVGLALRYQLDTGKSWLDAVGW